jgi:dTMP kinase
VFVTLEGLDGVGKSTQARLLADRLRTAGHEVVECREPGGTPLGERVRALLLERGSWAVSERAEALLFAASRAQLVAEVVRPALARGAWVVCDRYLDSSVAYQGAARGLGADRVRDVSLFAVDGLLPDRTILLVGAVRAAAEADRIEAEAGGFHVAVDRGFREAAAAEPERFRVVDANGAVAAVARRIWAAIGS